MGDRMINAENIRISPKGKDFLKRFITNRRKIGTDEEDISYWKCLELIEKYFKNNNDEYIELTKIKWSNKNV